jgi:hypothetical protein
MVRIRRPVGCATVAGGPGVDGAGETERATGNGGVAGIVKADRSGRLDGPAIGVSGPLEVGFGCGGLSLICRTTQNCNRHIIKNDAHVRCLSTSLEPQFVGQCNNSP